MERDELGIHPLYVFNGLSGRAYADSVVGALRSGVPGKLDIAGLCSFMLCGAVQEPFTLIEGVRSVPPLYDTRNFGRVRFTVRDAAQAEITATLERAVVEANCHNAFLSGGIDSSSIVAILRRMCPDAEIKTFCLLNNDIRTDERVWARKVSEHNRTIHTEFPLSGEFVREHILEAVDSYDQPSVDGINGWFANWFVAEAGVKSILSGTGGDEVFAGYGCFAKPRLAYRYCRIFHHMPSLVGRGIVRLGRTEKIRKFGQMFGCAYDPYFLTRRQFDEDSIRRLLDIDESRFVEVAKMYDEMQMHVGTKDVCFGDDVINRCSWMEIRHNLLSMFVRDGVQTSRCFGLDVKFPLLSKEIVDLMLSLPGEWKCEDDVEKPLLVRAAGCGIPDECVHRRKQGFALPFDRYFKGELRELLEDFVSTGGTGIFVHKELKRVWARYLSGRLSWHRIWQCFVLDRWLKRNAICL